MDKPGEIPEMDTYDHGMYGYDAGSGFGESESAGGRSSLFQEFPERMRAGSEDSGHGLELRFNKSRRSSDVHSLQSRFEFEPSPHGSSVMSQRSRLISVGEADLGHSLLGLEAEADESLFKDQSLQEEPETQTQGQGISNKVIYTSRV
jgi:hypothetical protein